MKERKIDRERDREGEKERTIDREIEIERDQWDARRLASKRTTLRVALSQTGRAVVAWH